MCLGVRRRVPPDTGIIQVNRVFCLYDDQVFLSSVGIEPTLET